MRQMITLAPRGGLRTYVYSEGKSVRPVHKLHFYRDGQIVYTAPSSWIEGKDDQGIRQDLKGLALNTLRRAIKVDLSKGHFYVSTGKKDFYTSQTSIDVYVDLTVGDVTITDPETVELYSSETGTTYHQVRKLRAGLVTLTVAVPNTITTQNTRYGMAVLAVENHMKEKGIERLTVDAIAKDYVLFALLAEARTEFVAEKKA